MKLVQHSSLWGNLYRHRYYVDGKRVTKAEYTRRHSEADPIFLKRKMEKSTSWYRITYTDTV